MTQMSAIYLLPIMTAAFVLAVSFADLRATTVKIRSNDDSRRRR